MTPEQLRHQLDSLLTDWEGECVEFKDANDNFSTSDIGRYFSALANEANLRERDAGWLVFGVDNKTRKIIGTRFREDHERLHSLKRQIADGTDPIGWQHQGCRLAAGDSMSMDWIRLDEIGANLIQSPINIP